MNFSEQGRLRQGSVIKPKDSSWENVSRALYKFHYGPTVVDALCARQLAALVGMFRASLFNKFQ